MCFKYEKNIGPINRIVRLAIGGVLLLSGFYLFGQRPILPFVLALIGIGMIIESAAGFCVWHSIRGTKDMR